MKKILIVDNEINLIKQLIRDISFWCEQNEIEILSSTIPADTPSIIKRNQEIFLIITDYMMPDMLGDDLAKIAKLINPEIIVFLMSGYPNLDLVIGEKNTDISYLIEKPWNHSVLIAELEKTLKSVEKTT